MGKDFLNLKTDPKRLRVLVLAGGLILTLFAGVRSFLDRELETAYQLPRAEELGGSYEQELVAQIEKERISVNVTVEERILTEEEAKLQLTKAEELLPDLLKAENEALSKITGNLNFVRQIPDSFVEVEWTETQIEFFDSEGKLRKEPELSEPVELEIMAILSCQEYQKDFKTLITLYPRIESVEEQLQKVIQKENQEHPDYDAILLPKEHQGKTVTWKKPLDMTFLYLLGLTIGAVIFLKLGVRRDVEEAKRVRAEDLERDYAQIVSKFTMLLSAGLSVRNAWERIVFMYRRKASLERVVYQELSWGLKELQKGVSELEVYEKVGIRTNQIHYKKLMSLFISDKRRGSVNLLDAMNQEMLQAWEEQKRRTRQQGEKIGTKLLIPMMGMLGVVFIIILVPAFLSFQL